ncbi:STAS domain-containing protein [Terasakiella sp. A23]|uniref:STAS domain-containing protein n=1 Tax=Terasakiella sp. FCG-A23 TaxID=3080561 RepID=UPI002954A0B1|nr:STAS domain-containing protein [Terasakiella sp. A23]MDV7339241.1 STAS domain-containing protein [Terasakiella sp. A23]
MKYSLIESNGVVNVQLSGELTVSDEDDFRGLTSEAMALNAQKYSIDVTKLDFLDSAGLGLMLVFKEFCEESGKSVTMKVAGSAVRDVLDISEFQNLIPYEDA